MKQRLVNRVHHWLPQAASKRFRIPKTPPKNSKSCLSANHPIPIFRSTSCTSSDFNSHWRAYSSTAPCFQSSINQENDDLYAEFRNNKNLTPQQWDDLEKEVVQTHSRLDQELCQDVLRELITKQQQFPPVAGLEVGPTGVWSYEFSQKQDRMVYTRHRFEGDEVVEQVVLDLGPNDQVLSMSLSVDESMIAYVIKDGNSTTPTLCIRQVESGSEAELQVSQEMTGDLAAVEFGPMSGDSSNQQQEHQIYLLGSDTQGRPDRVFVSKVDFGSNNTITVDSQNHPTLLYQSDDPAVMVDVQRTKGCQYISIRAMTKTTSEIFLTNGTDTLTPVVPQTEGLQYHLDVGNAGDVFILAGAKGSEFGLLETTVDELPLKVYDLPKYEILGSDADYAIYDMDLFQDHIVTYERSKFNGLQRVRVHDRHNRAESAAIVPLPIPAESSSCYHLSPAGNMCFASHQLCFKVETPVHAGEAFMYDFDMDQVICIAKSTPQAYGFVERSERVMVPSDDGTMVPMSLVYREGSNGSANNMNQDDDGSLFGKLFGSFEEHEGGLPTTNIVLMAYGSYGEPTDLQYNPWHALLVQRGYILAFAYTRGGGDLGREWYAQGCREHKVRAIEDLEACAKYLRQRYYGAGTDGKLTAATYSAGGVLVGAAMNRNPDLFHNAILTNAFLDVYQTLKNPDLYLTPHEWDEYGSPLDSDDADTLIQSYCPITNLKFMAECPNTLVIGTVDDENVPFWNAVIYAKKLRECIHDKDRVHLHLESTGGHHLGERRIHVSALEMAFIVQQCEGKEEDAELW